MNLINNISNYIIPALILIIMIFALKERIKIFEVFVEGAEEGVKIIYKLIPTLVGIFFSIELLRCSGVIDLVTEGLKPIIRVINIPSEIMPLAIIRPISGSGAIGVATDIMKEHGVDTYIGKVAAVIMGSTETTFYTIAVYTSGLEINKSNKLIAAALTADVVGMLAAVEFCRILSTSFS